MKAKYLAANLFRLPRMYNALRVRAPLTVLAYHIIPASFQQHIAFLRKHYSFVTIQQVIDHYEKKSPLPKNALLLTFDDGHSSILSIAKPVLQSYRIRALVFPPTSLLEGASMPWWDVIAYAQQRTSKSRIRLGGKEFYVKGERALKSLVAYASFRKDSSSIANEIVTALGVTIPGTIPDSYGYISWNTMDKVFDYGSHTHSHPFLSVQDIGKTREELLRSKMLLEQHLKKKIETFCYPHGDYNFSVVQAVGEKYTLGFSYDWGYNDITTNPLLLRRIGVAQDDNQYTLALKLSMLLHPVYLFRNRAKNPQRILADQSFFNNIIRGDVQ